MGSATKYDIEARIAKMYMNQRIYFYYFDQRAEFVFFITTTRATGRRTAYETKAAWLQHSILANNIYDSPNTITRTPKLFL